MVAPIVIKKSKNIFMKIGFTRVKHFAQSSVYILA